MPSFITALNPEVQAALITALVTVLMGIGGLFVLIWRLGKEAERVIEQSKNAETTKLKLTIYENKVVPLVDEIVDVQGKLTAFLNLFVTQIKSATHVQRGLPVMTPLARLPALIELKNAFDLASIQIISFTERWQIIDPRLAVFRVATNAALHDFGGSFNKIYDVAAPWMPYDIPVITGTDAKWRQPNAAKVEEIEKAVEKANDDLVTVVAYAHDFLTEMQNALVGPLFDASVPARRPIDQRRVVVTLEKFPDLMHHFKENTEWGKSQKETDARVRAILPKG